MLEMPRTTSKLIYINTLSKGDQMNKFKLIKFGHRVVSVGLGIVAVAVPTATTVMADEVQNEWEKPRAEFIEDAEFNALLEKMKADGLYTC